MIASKPEDIMRGNTGLKALVFAAAALANMPALSANQALIEAAKKEGQLTWYTTQIVNQFVTPAKAAFEKKYGIRINFIRADPPDIVVRLINEAKAGRVQGDVYDGTATSPGIKRAGIAMKWIPDDAARLGKDYIDPEGFWVATNLYVLTPGYNKDLIKPAEAPKTFADLLNPRWKGQIAWADLPVASGSAGFIGVVLAEMGEEKGMAYLRDLSRQNIIGMKASARQVMDKVIAGEFPLALAMFNHHATISAQKGAPSAWIPMNPAMAVLSVAGVTKDARNPNAAKLLIDFLISREGQEIYRDTGYIPVDPQVPPGEASLRPDGKNFRAVSMTPEAVDEQMPRWAKIASELFR